MKDVASLWSRLGEVAALVATPLLPSHYVGLLRPLGATHALQARVEAVRDEAPGVRTLTLRPARGFRPHLPGQHVRVGVAVAGRLVTRTYSISSAPGARTIEITVKAQGRVSNALVHDLEPGAFVTLSQPSGELTLPAEPSVLFITAGSGITPIASMLRAYAGALPDIIHVHYARTAADMIFGAELRALAAAHPAYRLVEVHTASDPRRFSAERLAELAPDWQSRPTWACAPQPMLDAITHAFTVAGRGDSLHVERFRAALAVLPTDARGGCVRFGAAPLAADATTPLLHVAEAAGLAPRSGCRMGICHTCDVTLVSGRVRDLRTGALLEEPGTRVQICVCAAAGDAELTP